jgi:hypothetical protein
LASLKTIVEEGGTVTAAEMAWLLPSEGRLALQTGGPYPTRSLRNRLLQTGTKSGSVSDKEPFQETYRTVVKRLWDGVTAEQAVVLGLTLEYVAEALWEHLRFMGETGKMRALLEVLQKTRPGAKFLDRAWSVTTRVVAAPLFYCLARRRWTTKDLKPGTYWNIATVDNEGAESHEPVEIVSHHRGEVTYQFLMPTGTGRQFQLAWIDPKRNQVALASRDQVRKASGDDMRKRYRPWTGREGGKEFMDMIEDALTKMPGDKKGALVSLVPTTRGRPHDEATSSENEESKESEEETTKAVTARLVSDEARGSRLEQFADDLEALHREQDHGRKSFRDAQRDYLPWRQAMDVLEGKQRPGTLYDGGQGGIDDDELQEECLSMMMKDGLLQQFDERSGVWRICVPPAKKMPLIWAYHHSPLGGHVSPEKLVALLRGKYYWRNMAREIRAEVAACECRMATGVRRQRVPLRARKVVGPLQAVSIDIYGPLPLSWAGNVVVLSVQCVGSRWLELMPMADATAQSVAHHFVTGWVCRHGVPKVVIMDQGPQFTSWFMKAVFENLRMEIKLVAVDRHFSNPVERTHRTLGALLRTYVSKDQRDWDEQLPYVAFAIRAYSIGTSGVSPFELLKGMLAPLPGDTWQATMETHEDTPEWLTERAATMRTLFLRFRDTQAGIRARAVRYKNRKCAPHPPGAVAPGTEVARLVRNRSGGGLSATLMPGPYVPGYVVVEEHGDGRLTIRKKTGRRLFHVHEDDVRPERSSSDRKFLEQRGSQILRMNDLGSVPARAGDVGREDSSADEDDEEDARESPEGTDEDEADPADVFTQGTMVVYQTGRQEPRWGVGIVWTTALPEATAVEVQACDTHDVDRDSGAFQPRWLVTKRGVSRVMLGDPDDNREQGDTVQPDTAMVPI